MALVAEFDIPCTHLPLVDVAAAVPEPTLVLELQFNHGGRPLFLLTVTRGAAADDRRAVAGNGSVASDYGSVADDYGSVTDDYQSAIETALSETGDVAGSTLVGRAGETLRYKAHPARSLEEQLGAQIQDLSELEALATADAIIDRIEVTPTGWTQTGWFADRAAFTQFRTFWQANTGFRLQRLTHDDDPEPPGDGLTDRQTEALRTAYEMGYFDIPRGASLEAVAAELGVSASSVSERLRRAQTQLIEETVATMWPPLPD